MYKLGHKSIYIFSVFIYSSASGVDQGAPFYILVHNRFHEVKYKYVIFIFYF